MVGSLLLHLQRIILHAVYNFQRDMRLRGGGGDDQCSMPLNAHTVTVGAPVAVLILILRRCAT